MAEKHKRPLEWATRRQMVSLETRTYGSNHVTKNRNATSKVRLSVRRTIVMRPLPFLGLLCGTLLVSTTSHAQMGTMRYRFRSRAAVVPALQKARGNLRNTYDVLICAARQGYRNTALGYYEGVVSGHEFDATVQDSAAFAFAHDLADNFSPWYWKRDTDFRDYKGSSRGSAVLFKDRAFKYGAGSPEVLVMRAYKARLFFKEDRKQAYEWCLKAVKQSPQWADGYYWLSEAADNYALSLQDEHKPLNQARIVRLGVLEMRACDKAEHLDPGLHYYLYINRINASELIADKKAARMIPIYADAFLRAFPEYAVFYKRVGGKDEAQIRAMYARIAADIAAKAKS